MEYPSPLDKLYHWEKNCPGKVFMQQPIDGVWHSWTWAQAAREARTMAAALRAMDLPPGSNIALISKNCAHWIICDLAIMLSGHVSVPLYPNLNAASIGEILTHSGARVLFVGKLDDWSSMRPGVPEGIHCISFPFYSHPEYANWSDIILRHAPLAEDVHRDAQEIATIIYTSGTTGAPKAVMHSFHNIGFAIMNAIPHVGLDHIPRFFSYLPLSHIAERLLVEMCGIYTGGEIFFAESIERFAANMAYAKPTVFLGVHRIWKKFQEGILEKLSQRKLNILLRIPVVSGLIKKKIKKGLGLEKAVHILTGAAPTPEELLEWFQTVGIRIQEAYAMTENCCYSHVTLPGRIKIGWVGQPLPHCTVKLGEDREILIRHEGLMKGYYKQPGLTAETFTADGFLRTGDEGVIDEEGFLKITGRAKDPFKTSKGKYVSPSSIEMKLSGSADIEFVCVVGTGLPQPIALVMLSGAAKKRAREEVSAGLEKLLAAVNPSLDAHEQLGKLVLVEEEWSVENGMLTPSFKIKRNEIERKYAGRYGEWYEGKGSVIGGEGAG
jgi:long-chain acyl-CoA synthetase